jgi:hypothetical protein
MSALLLFSTTIFGANAPKGGKLHETHVARSCAADEEVRKEHASPEGTAAQTAHKIAFEQNLRRSE